jgi:signal transduction histidine kinase
MGIASHKIETVVKRVMDFSKPNQQKMQSINVNECVRDAVDLAAVTLRKSGITLKLTLDDNLSACCLNRLSIEQMLLNLITNAREELIESEGERQIEVQIRTARGSSRYRLPIPAPACLLTSVTGFLIHSSPPSNMAPGSVSVSAIELSVITMAFCMLCRASGVEPCLWRNFQSITRRQTDGDLLSLYC